jgi:quercetin dioxygenase-like cupin family protein
MSSPDRMNTPVNSDAETSPTVSEHLLVRAEETDHGQASLALIDLQFGSRLDIPSSDDEISYYLLAGRGSVSFSHSGLGSRWIIDPDCSIWVAAGVAHSIVNAGEGPFRCLVARCKSKPPNVGGKRVSRRSQWPVHELVGFTSRTIFARSDLVAMGASRTLGVDLETLSPRSILATHSHDEEIIYMLRGKGFVRTDSGDTPVEPGSAVYTGSFVPHSVHNTEDEIFQYLVWEFSL